MEALDAERRRKVRGTAIGLLAAALFGVSPPLSKLLLPGSGPLSLAALLYLGAGLGLAAVRLVSRRTRASREAKLRQSDLRLLIGIAVTGGVFGPILLLVGLERLPAVSSALLLNLEAPFTILLALALFREHLDYRELIGVALVFAGALVISYRSGRIEADWVGIMAIAGACFCWAVDNNLTQKLSLREPLSIVQFKTLAAGSFTLVLALIAHQPFARLSRIGAALLLGSMSYGVSIVLHVYALRALGAARQAAFFSTAPFAGALIAIPLLGERPGWGEATGAVAMVLGIVAIARARHGHVHTHEPLEHDHLHVHDEHHQHEHGEPVSEPHSHLHRHDPLTHEHAHVSDVHHRHPHK